MKNNLIGLILSVGLIFNSAMEINAMSSESQVEFYDDTCYYALNENNNAIITICYNENNTYDITQLDDYSFSFINPTSVSFPDSITSIGSCAFYNCQALKSISIPSSVETIGDWAFCDCISLKSADISHINEISNNLFNGCLELKNVYISKDTVSIGEGAFFDCENLTDVYFDGSEAD